MQWEALCLIFSENIAVFKEYNIARHWNPSVHSVEIIDSLVENFKMRLTFVVMLQMYISLKPFSVEVRDASEKLQLELSEMQYD
jgi:hypothetical protein